MQFHTGYAVGNKAIDFGVQVAEQGVNGPEANNVIVSLTDTHSPAVRCCAPAPAWSQ